MCECGCTMMGSRYKAAGPDGKWYLVALLPGCKDCDVPPSVRITLVNPGSYLEETEADAEPLPFGPVDGDLECSIYSGLSKSEFRKACSDTANGWPMEGDALDEYDGELLGEELWDEHLCKEPEIRFPATKES